MRFLNPLHLEYLDGRFWKVLDSFDYAVGSPDGKTVVHVEEGFLTDFASIPKLFWSLLPPTGWYGKAAVIHDKLYKDGCIGKMVIPQKYADDVLNEAMCVLSAEWILTRGRSTPDHPQIPKGELRSLVEREVIYRGVRLGGWTTWKKYRKHDSEGN